MSRDTASSDGVGTVRTSRRAEGGATRRRRDLLTGAAAAALGVITAETLAGAAPAQASQGQAVIEGKDNTGATARTGIFTTGNKEWAQLADPGNASLGSQGVYGAGQHVGVRGEAAPSLADDAAGVVGQGVISFSGVTAGSGRGVLGKGFGSGTGVEGSGGSSNGIGVIGRGGGDELALIEAGQGVVGIAAVNGYAGVVGISGQTGDGLIGTANSGNGVRGDAGAAGVGVRAENTSGGTALHVAGPAVFSRSGVLTVAAGKSSVTKTGVPLTSASLVLAVLQQDQSGIWVRSAVPNVPGKSFTIHLSKNVTHATKVAWFIVN